MKHPIFFYIALCGGLLLTACRGNLDPAGEEATPGNIIRVGGLCADELVATSALTKAESSEESITKTDAENISWLVEPLENGLDITYGLSSDRTNTSRVAILKLLTTTGEVGGPIKYSEDGSNKYAEYSFLYRNNSTGAATTDPAIWHGNGAHFFEGLYIPDKIQYNASATTPETIEAVATSAPNLTTDQHGDGATSGSLGNYTLLSRYLGMPSNYTINATVARIKLPFRHRMARVLAYILIDPEMGDDIKIEGYSLTDGEDDPTTSEIRFCNVKVLQGVKASYDSDTKHYVYTPQWTEARKVVPHFVGERASYDDEDNSVKDADNFIAFYDVNEKTYSYPTDDDWSELYELTYDATTGLTSDGAYQKISYGKVPVYDLIVRPTYTSLSNVMYDEEGVSNSTTKYNLYAATNQIDFDITLNNGLQYEKRFTFDLDANYQTVVYLHISEERVDYNSSGSEIWVETKKDDDYYGVNNQNGNTLSIAGSSWQRAYTNSDTDYDVTDGHQYLHDTEDEYAQYVTDEKWIEMFLEAYEGGEHHGDYFILKGNVSISAALIPDNFVFTGHLDGQGHTITVVSGTKKVVDTEAYDENTYVEYADGEGGNLTKYVQSGENWIEATGTYYSREESTDPTTNEVTYSYSEITDLTAYTGNTAYTRSGEEGSYTYTPVIFRKLVVVHHDEVSHNVTVNPSALLAGLNGKYTTAQESNASATWEANVHKEARNSKTYWVPYKGDADGWRAEVFNLNVSGAALLSSPTYPPTENATVTGYVHSCTDKDGHVTDYTPAIPVY